MREGRNGAAAVEGGCAAGRAGFAASRFAWGRWRRSCQVATVLLFLVIPLLNLWGVTAVTGTLYSVNILGLSISDPLVVLQHILATRGLHIAFLLSAVVPLALSLWLGPVFCSWLCPQGLLSEIADNLRRRLRPQSVSRRDFAPAPKRSAWIRLKWGLFLAGLVAAGLSAIPVQNYLSAPGIISGQMAGWIFLGEPGVEALLPVAIVVVEFFWLRRGWCKALCPIGSALIAVKTPWTLRAEHDAAHRCVPARCHLVCTRVCQLGIDPRNRGELWLCTNCADCVEACPDQALGWYGRPTAADAARQGLDRSTLP